MCQKPSRWNMCHAHIASLLKIEILWDVLLGTET